MPEISCEKSECSQQAFSVLLLEVKSMSSLLVQETAEQQSAIAVPVNMGSDVSMMIETDFEELSPAPLKAVTDTLSSDPSCTCCSKNRSIEPNPVMRDERLFELALPKINPSVD